MSLNWVLSLSAPGDLPPLDHASGWRVCGDPVRGKCKASKGACGDARGVRRGRGSGGAGRAGDSWAPCAAPPALGLLAAARPRRSAPAAELRVEGGCWRAGGRASGAARSVRVRGCECASPLPGIPPQPGQRGASSRGERHVTADLRAPRPQSPSWAFGSFETRPLGGGGRAGNPSGAVSPGWGGRGRAEYGGSALLPLAENRSSALVGDAPALLPLPVRRAPWGSILWFRVFL